MRLPKWFLKTWNVTCLKNMLYGNVMICESLLLEIIVKAGLPKNYDWVEKMAPTSHQKLTRASLANCCIPTSMYEQWSGWAFEQWSSWAVEHGSQVTSEHRSSSRPSQRMPKPIINSPPALTVPFQSRAHTSTKLGLVTTSIHISESMTFLKQSTNLENKG